MNIRNRRPSSSSQHHPLVSRNHHFFMCKSVTATANRVLTDNSIDVSDAFCVLKKERKRGGRYTFRKVCRYYICFFLFVSFARHSHLTPRIYILSSCHNFCVIHFLAICVCVCAYPILSYLILFYSILSYSILFYYSWEFPYPSSAGDPAIMAILSGRVWIGLVLLDLGTQEYCTINVSLLGLGFG